jgi:hypothetical protein
LEANGSQLLTWRVVTGKWIYTCMKKRRLHSWQVKGCGSSRSYPSASATFHECLSR